MSSNFKYEPINRNPVYKMRQNLNKEEAQEAQAASLPLFGNALKSFSPLHPGSPVNGAGRRPNTINLSDALPLLSSSVPANERIISARILPPLSRKTQLPTLSEHPSNESSVKVKDQESAVNHKEVVPTHHQERSIPRDTAGEAELRNLFAASAPSHRHAWKEGGAAWKIFHRLHSPISDNPIVEDDGEDPWSEAVSDSEG